ncbi:hypothetical protein V6N13_109729 [Hibiscus sabdariffa]
MALADVEWKWGLFDQLLPRDVLLHIAVIKGPLLTMAEASIGWKPSPSSRFSLKSTYDVRLGDVAYIPDKLWKTIHNFCGPQRIWIFLWLICKNKVLTNAERSRRQLTHDASCPICHHVAEDVDQLLRFCPTSIAIWQQLVLPGKLESFLSMDICRWVLVNLNSSDVLAQDMEN